MADRPVAMFEIKKYMIVWRQEEKRTFQDVEATIRGIVRCIGDDYVMDVFFLTEESPIPQPMIDLENNKGAVFLSITDMLAFVDMLRNEKPIFGHLRADRPEWTSITTTEEPVGIGDEDWVDPD